ncbi:hypothetical protein ACQKIW_28165 [Bacillus thuringiensis]|uniref:hypothetical protein n=1 Tax=Bacillus thuringiensis TaxID=1428 RepID=UPI003CFFEB8F
MNGNSNKDLLASLNVNPACVQPATINPNHFDQELLASLNLNPACLKPTDVVKITPVLVNGQVILQTQLANGSLIVTSQEYAAISLDTDNHLPIIPSNPYQDWPIQSSSSTTSQSIAPGEIDYIYLPVTAKETQLPGRVYWGSSPDGVNPIYKGYGPMQLFRPDFTMIREHDDAYQPDYTPGNLILYMGLQVKNNPLVQNPFVEKISVWNLLPDNPLLSRGLAGQWHHPVSSGVSSSELNMMAMALGIEFNPNFPSTTFNRLQAAFSRYFKLNITTATTSPKEFDYSKPGPNYPYNDYKIGVYQLEQIVYLQLHNSTPFLIEEWSSYSLQQYYDDISTNPNNVKMPDVTFTFPLSYNYKSSSLWAAATPGSQSRVTDNSQYNSQTF